MVEGREEARGAGKSSEGKSSPLEEGKMHVEALGVGVPGDEGGEVRGVGVWKWTCALDGVWAGDLRRDIGGVMYPVIVGVVSKEQQGEQRRQRHAQCHPMRR